MFGLWSACASVGNILGAFLASCVLKYGYEVGIAVWLLARDCMSDWVMRDWFLTLSLRDNRLRASSFIFLNSVVASSRQDRKSIPFLTLPSWEK